MAPPEDPYGTLGVSPTATAAEIRGAWRRLAVATHPDRNPGDPSAEGRFKAAAAAYGILGDPRLRAEWDSRRAEWDRRRAPPEPPPRAEPVHPGPPLDPAVATRPGAAQPPFLASGLGVAAAGLWLLLVVGLGYAGGPWTAALLGALAACFASPWGFDSADPLRPWAIRLTLLGAAAGLWRMVAGP